MYVWSGFYEGMIYGFVVDFGFIIIVVYFCDLKFGEVIVFLGFMNLQICFGEDFMSCVSYFMMNEGGDLEMICVVCEGMNVLFV